MKSQLHVSTANRRWKNNLHSSFSSFSPLSSLLLRQYHHHRNHRNVGFNKQDIHPLSLLHSSRDAADGKSQQISSEDDNNDTNAASTTTASIPPSQQEGKQLQSRTQDKIITITTTAETSAAMLEAQVLREKARRLLEEANEAEIALKKITTKKKDSINTETDELISNLLLDDDDDEDDDESVEGIPYKYEGGVQPMQLVEEKRRERINHVTDKLRSLSLSTDKLIRLVERIHERQMDLSPENKMSSSSMNGDDSANEATSTFMIGAATNAAVTRLRTKQKLSDLLDDIVNATSVLDEERTTSTVAANGNSSKNISSNDAIRMAKFQMPPIRARVKELRKAADAEFNRRLAYEFSTASKNGNNGRQFRGEDETLDELVTRTMTENGDFYYPESNKNNTMSEYLRNVVEVPMWVPLQLLPFVVTAKPEDELSTKEWKELKSEVFQGSRFFVTSWDSMRFAAVYRGNFMRVAPASTALPNSIEKNIIGSDGKEETPSSPIGTKKPNGIGNTAKEIPTSQIIFSDLQNRLEQSSLKDKIQLFLVEEYDDPNGDTAPNPVVIALPKAIEPERASERGNGVKVLSVRYLRFCFLPNGVYFCRKYFSTHDLRNLLISHFRTYLLCQHFGTDVLYHFPFWVTQVWGVKKKY